MVKEMEYTDFSTDEIQSKLEELLRSGWAVLLASDDITYTVMNAVKPENFRAFMLMGAGYEKILKIVCLVRVAVIMGGDDPEVDETCALLCHSIKKLENGLKELEYTPLPVPDELVGEFVKIVLKKGC